MCGLAGVYNISRQDFSIDERLLEKMGQKIAHRGPDAHAVWFNNEDQIGFAFRRLQIIDLSSAAMQPMFDREKTVAICFNGEIYNHLALRKELESLGYQYFSQSDTESLLYAYKEWGIDFIHRLEGMFAIALYDFTKHRLYLIRDRIGVKPLYFSLQGGVLSFASEIKALWELPWMEKKISQQGLYHYLTFMVAPAPYTIFEGVYKLPAGYFIAVDDKKNIEFVEWYNPVTALTAQEKQQFEDEDFCTDNIRSLLLEATKKRLISDVPFGAFLSGGVDSSFNVALMAQFVDRVKTFTVAFSDGPEFDELRWARKVADKFGTDHHEIIISEKEAFDFYEPMVYHLDEPLSDCVCIPFYHVARLAKDSGVTVAQVGEGSDELFFGYSTYARQKHFYDRWWQPTSKFLPALMKRAVQGFVKPFIAHHLGRAEIMDNWVKNRRLFWGGALAFNEHQKHSILKHDFDSPGKPTHDDVVAKIYPGLRQEYDSFAFVDYHLSSLLQRHPNADFCQQMLYLELKQRLPELLLMRADKMAMAASVEAREPFLDHKLVEFMYHVPARLKFKNGVTKYLLKKVAKEFLPADVIHRKKMGFAAPTERWFAQGRYFPSYFAQQTSHAQSSFGHGAACIEKLYHNHPAHFAVQNWTLQNLWALR